MQKFKVASKFEIAILVSILVFVDVIQFDANLDEIIEEFHNLSAFIVLILKLLLSMYLYEIY